MCNIFLALFTTVLVSLAQAFSFGNLDLKPDSITYRNNGKIWYGTLKAPQTIHLYGQEIQIEGLVTFHITGEMEQVNLSHPTTIKYGGLDLYCAKAVFFFDNGNIKGGACRGTTFYQEVPLPFKHIIYYKNGAPKRLALVRQAVIEIANHRFNFGRPPYKSHDSNNRDSYGHISFYDNGQIDFGDVNYNLVRTPELKFDRVTRVGFTPSGQINRVQPSSRDFLSVKRGKKSVQVLVSQVLAEDSMEFDREGNVISATFVDKIDVLIQGRKEKLNGRLKFFDNGNLNVADMGLPFNLKHPLRVSIQNRIAQVKSMLTLDHNQRVRLANLSSPLKLKTAFGELEFIGEIQLDEFERVVYGSLTKPQKILSNSREIYVKRVTFDDNQKLLGFDLDVDTKVNIGGNEVVLSSHALLGSSHFWDPYETTHNVLLYESGQVRFAYIGYGVNLPTANGQQRFFTAGEKVHFDLAGKAVWWNSKNY